MKSSKPIHIHRGILITLTRTFLDTAIQELKAKYESWTQQRHAWYLRGVDDLLPLLKESYNFVSVKKDPFGENEYETRYYLDSRKIRTLDVNLWEDEAYIHVMSNDASFDLVLNNAIDYLIDDMKYLLRIIGNQIFAFHP